MRKYMKYRSVISTDLPYLSEYGNVYLPSDLGKAIVHKNINIQVPCVLITIRMCLYLCGQSMETVYRRVREYMRVFQFISFHAESSLQALKTWLVRTVRLHPSDVSHNQIRKTTHDSIICFCEKTRGLHIFQCNKSRRRQDVPIIGIDHE